MPRPGPRPYAFERKAWHCDRHHQPIRGSLVKEIFRVVNEIHSSATKKNKEWQEKLPVVVLKAEEIMYSKANSEAEYMDLNTLWDRTNDAINTIIRRDESTETGKLLQPCIEAALNLGCTATKTSRSQPPICGPNGYPKSSTRGNLMAHSHCLANYSDIMESATNVTRSSFESRKHTGWNGYCTAGKFSFASENGSLPNYNQCLPLDKYSVYPLYYCNDLKSEEPWHGFRIFPRSISKTVEPAKTNKIDVRNSPNDPHPQIACDLSLRLGPLSTPCLSVGNDQTQGIEDTGSTIGEWIKFRARGNSLPFFHMSNRDYPLNSSSKLNKRMRSAGSFDE